MKNMTWIYSINLYRLHFMINVLPVNEKQAERSVYVV